MQRDLLPLLFEAARGTHAPCCSERRFCGSPTNQWRTVRCNVRLNNTIRRALRDRLPTPSLALTPQTCLWHLGQSKDRPKTRSVPAPQPHPCRIRVDGSGARATSDYRVLPPSGSSTSLRPHAQGSLSAVLVLDTETTGLDQSREQDHRAGHGCRLTWMPRRGCRWRLWLSTTVWKTRHADLQRDPGHHCISNEMGRAIVWTRRALRPCCKRGPGDCPQRQLRSSIL